MSLDKNITNSILDEGKKDLDTNFIIEELIKKIK